MTEATGSGRRDRKTVGRGIATGGVLVLLVVGIAVAIHATGGSAGSPLPTVSPYPKDYVAPFERLLDAARDPFPNDLARSGRFVDASHGFLAVDRCGRTPRDEPDNCHRLVMATSDGGATITALNVPAIPDSGGLSLLVFGPRDLVIMAAPPEHNAVPRSWVSHDAGATWRAGPELASQPIQRIPAGGQLFQTEMWGPVEAVSADGSGSFFTGLPGHPQPYQATPAWQAVGGPIQGAYFAAETRQGGSTVWVTRDNGATWQATNLPWFDSSLRMYGYDGHQFLAGDGPMLFASPDGVAWHKVATPTFIPIRWRPPGTLSDRPLADPSGPPGTPPSGNFSPEAVVDVALSPAGLLVTDETNMFRVVPGTSRFVLLPGVPSTADFTGFGGRLIALQADGDHIREVSTVDGQTWTPTGYR